MEFDILFRSTLEFSDGRPRQLVLEDVENDDDKEVKEEEEKKDEKCEVGVSSSSSSSSSHEDDQEEEVINKMVVAAARSRTLGGELEVDDDDDGFRTPTSLDQRIPVIQQCPPAPRKPKSFPNKRKAYSSATHGQLFLLDLSQEIESLFPLPLQADLGRKIKKVRGADDDTN